MTDRKVTAKRRAPHADAMRRATEAWHLRVQGRTWEEIAQTVGFENRSNAIRAVQRYAGDLPTPDREHLRKLARARGEVLFTQALADVFEQRPGAVRAAVALLQRQAQLDGLDEPRRTELSIEADSVEELVAELVAASGDEVVEADPLELDAEDAD